MSRPPDHPPGWENWKNSKTYDVNVKCTNCGDTSVLAVKKGTLLSDVLSETECENCGCTGTLVRR